MRGYREPGDPRIVGAGVGMVGGSAFVLVNRPALPGAWQPAVLVGWALLIAVCGYAVLVRERQLSAPPRPTRGAPTIYAGSVVGMVLVIGTGGRALTALGRAELVPALVALAVGLHFLPFSRAFGARAFRRIGLAMTALGLGGLLLGGLGAAVAAPASAVVAGGAMLALVAADAWS